jgi:hypothetical protein
MRDTIIAFAWEISQPPIVQCLSRLRGSLFDCAVLVYHCSASYSLSRPKFALVRESMKGGDCSGLE